MNDMISISLPDGSVRAMPLGTTPADVAAAIGPGLAKAALAVAILFVAIVFALPAVLRPLSERAGSFAARLSLGGIGSRAPPLSA